MTPASSLLHFVESLGTFPASMTEQALANYLPFVGAGFALLLMVVLTPLVIRLAIWAGWIAYPKHDRWHSQPVALMGGIAIFFSGAIAVAVSGAYAAFPWPVWLGAALVFGGGLADDLWDVRPEAKLVIQIVATVLLIYAGLAFWRGGPFWLSIPLTFFWVIGITNAVNLIDGMDGLASGLAAIAASILGIIAWQIGDPVLATVMGVVAGSAGGFLFFNFKPARIFMGDCGSMVLGFMLAALSMDIQGRGGPVAATLVPIVILAVPIFDTTFVTVTRILSGRPVTQGGTDHTMHRLVSLGLSERRTVLTLYVVSLVFGLCALALYWTTAQLFYALALLAIVVSAVFGLYLANSRSYEPTADTSHSLTTTQRIGAVMQALTGNVFWKSIAGTVADLIAVGAAFVAAYHLRFDGVPPARHLDLLMTALPGIVALKIGVFYVFRLYHGIWRHAGTPEIVRLVGASFLASLLTLVGLLVAFGVDRLSGSVLIIDWILTTLAVGGIRFGFRGLRQYFAAQQQEGRNVLIYGTGTDSLVALRYLRQNTSLARRVVGLLSEDDTITGMHVQGIPVIGASESLRDVTEQYAVDEIILPSEGVSSSDRNAIYALCRRLDLDCRHFSLDLSRPPFDAASGDGSSTILPPESPEDVRQSS